MNALVLFLTSALYKLLIYLHTYLHTSTGTNVANLDKYNYKHEYKSSVTDTSTSVRARGPKVKYCAMDKLLMPNQLGNQNGKSLLR